MRKRNLDYEIATRLKAHKRFEALQQAVGLNRDCIALYKGRIEQGITYKALIKDRFRAGKFGVFWRVGNGN